MRKIMVLIIVLVVAAVAQGGITPCLDKDISLDNITQVQSFDNILFVKCSDNSSYIVYFNDLKTESQAMANSDMRMLAGNSISLSSQTGQHFNQYTILNSLPNTATIISLAAGGFLLKHKKRKISPHLPLYI